MLILRFHHYPNIICQFRIYETIIIQKVQGCSKAVDEKMSGRPVEIVTEKTLRNVEKLVKGYRRTTIVMLLVLLGRYTGPTSDARMILIDEKYSLLDFFFSI